MWNEQVKRVRLRGTSMETKEKEDNTSKMVEVGPSTDEIPTNYASYMGFHHVYQHYDA